MKTSKILFALSGGFAIGAVIALDIGQTHALITVALFIGGMVCKAIEG